MTENQPIRMTETEAYNADMSRLRYLMSRPVATALADLITMVEWVASSKTPTGEVAEAKQRLQELANELKKLKETTVTETE
jgi:hypothetical protein